MRNKVLEHNRGISIAIIVVWNKIIIKSYAITMVPVTYLAVTRTPVNKLPWKQK